jgi:UDP-GlcNAc:undecaprenyl-phosphate GlcNAc-1-phosphate transferase
MAFHLFLLAICTYTVVGGMRSLAPSLGLIDTPCARKRHKNPTPVVGGIAIAVCLTIFLLTLDEPPYLLIVSIMTLATLGAIDDKFPLPSGFRLIVQALLGVALVLFSELQLATFGDILGFGAVELGWLAYPITIIAVVAAINAFNMIDGIDGLLGCVSGISFAGLALLFHIHNDTVNLTISLAMLAVILPFLTFNLGLLGQDKKVFMGDSGSMLIGFMMVWLLLAATQPTGMDNVSTTSRTAAHPVTALWLIAVPLLDMASLIYQRKRQGRSPMMPDRQHLHHLVQRAGLQSGHSLGVICTLSAGFMLFGIVGEVAEVSESTLFTVFVVTALLFYQCKIKTMRFVAFLRLRNQHRSPSLRH